MRKNLLLIIGFLLLSAIPLLMPHKTNRNVEMFTGTDTQAEQIIGEIFTGYVPWFKPLWKPPSSEIESLLFGLQASIGAGLIGYCLGYYRARNT
jgi:cobalt/nickel transport protein